LIKEQEGIYTETVAALKSIATSNQGLSKLQRKDRLICFLESGVQSEDEKLAKLVSLTRSQLVMHCIMYVHTDGTLKVISPSESQIELFNQVGLWRTPERC